MKIPEQNINMSEKKEIEPTEILKYMVEVGKAFSQYALMAQAMLEEAKERGIPVDLANNEVMKKFAPKGEYDVALGKIKGEMMDLSSELFKQGVKMTYAQVDERIKKMEEKIERAA